MAFPAPSEGGGIGDALVPHNKLPAHDDMLLALCDGLLPPHDNGVIRLHGRSVRLHEDGGGLMRSSGRKARGRVSMSDSLDKVDKEVSQQ